MLDELEVSMVQRIKNGCDIVAPILQKSRDQVSDFGLDAYVDLVFAMLVLDRAGN